MHPGDLTNSTETAEAVEIEEAQLVPEPQTGEGEELRKRRKPTAFIQWKPPGVTVVDVDVHVYDGPDELAPYCDMPWRRSLEHIASAPHRYNDLPGYAPRAVYHAVFPGEFKNDYSDSAEQLREDLDLLSIDHGIIFTNHFLMLCMLPDPAYATALAQAFNRWQMDKWVSQAPNLHGAVIVAPQDPVRAAKEIETYGGEPGVVAVAMPIAGIDPLLGHPMYDPILHAAEDAGLPIILHSAAVPYPAFPANMHRMANAFAIRSIAHVFSLMANLANLMGVGVPERFPKLKWVLTEAGIAWVPYMRMRFDRQYSERRRDVPALKAKPSDYMNSHVFVATQPIEEPANFADVAKLLDLYNGWDSTMFASDWPHHDFDHPRKIWMLAGTDEQKKKIMGDNAMRVFPIPPSTRKCP
jgi:predicted TIM-barrel fold metal-dependent hydrolase